MVVMENIKQRMEERYATKIVIENHLDPGDGSISLSAVMTDGYTDEELIRLDWYYDFDELIRDLNKRLGQAVQ